MIEYDKIIIIIYIRTYKDTYSYDEIKEHLGLSYAELNSFIDNLISEDILIYNDDYILEVSKEGLRLLSLYGLQNIQFDDLLIDYQAKMVSKISTEVKLGISDIYIPKNFNEKFEGYKK